MIICTILICFLCDPSNPVHCAVSKHNKRRPALQELRQRMLVHNMRRRLPADQLQHLLNSRFAICVCKCLLQSDVCVAHVWGCTMCAAKRLPMHGPFLQCGDTCSLYVDGLDCMCQQCKPGWQLSAPGICLETKSTSSSTAVIAGAAAGAAVAAAGELSQVGAICVSSWSIIMSLTGVLQ